MCKYIYIEDLVANALIELIENNNCRKIEFETLIKYGTVIIKYLRDNSTNAILLVSKDYASAMIKNYSGFFEIINPGLPNACISLKDGIEADDLREYFRSSLSFDVLLAFTSKDALLTLGLAA